MSFLRQQIFNGLYRAGKSVMQNPVLSVILGFIGPWFIIILTSFTVILYWVIQGVNESGLNKIALDRFTKATYELKGVAQHCTPKILNIQEFFYCLKDTPEYIGDDATRRFENSMNQVLNNQIRYPDNFRDMIYTSPYEADLNNQNIMHHNK